jgi:dTDP-4-amino-4,6-dideoxygalactose transaminase
MLTDPGISHVPLIDLKAQVEALGPQLNAAMSNVIQKTDFILGEDVSLFEEAFAAYCGAWYAVGVGSGTTALEVALRAFDVGPGDEVITAANISNATALAITATGAVPVLVDIDPRTYTLDPCELDMALGERTKAIIPAHLYGQPADIDPILQFARMHHLVVIEDASQAHGARYKGKRVGSLGDAAAFSFSPAKNLGAFGDGGMVVTSNEDAADRLRLLRDIGQCAGYQDEIVECNDRLDTIQAAVLNVKLPYLDAWNEARRRHAAQYQALLGGHGIVTPAVAGYAEPVWHLYVVRIKKRDTLRDLLWKRGIGTGVHYPEPLHLQPAYQELGYHRGDFPVAERFSEQVLSLPMYAEMPEEAVQYIAANLIELVEEHQAMVIPAG